MIKTLYEKFQPWSDGANIWFVSDTHFDNPDCGHIDPDWPTPKEHVKLINHAMKKNDTLVHLGDVGDPKYIKWIDGKRKILITGNHDLGASKYVDYFDEIYTGPLIIAEKIILSHEPVDVSWAFNIHGHVHRKEYLGDTHHLNLAANVVGFQPVSLKNLITSGVLANITSLHRLTIDAASV